MDKNKQIHGRAEGVNHQAGRQRHGRRGDISQGGDQSGDLFQLEETIRRAVADRGETPACPAFGHWRGIGTLLQAYCRALELACMAPLAGPAKRKAPAPEADLQGRDPNWQQSLPVLFAPRLGPQI